MKIFIIKRNLLAHDSPTEHMEVMEQGAVSKPLLNWKCPKKYTFDAINIKVFIPKLIENPSCFWHLVFFLFEETLKAGIWNMLSVGNVGSKMLRSISTDRMISWGKKIKK